MSVRVGIIGVGIMGADHARVLSSHVPGAVLQALYDADAARARAVAEETGARSVAADAFALVRDPNIDAVLVASPDATHKDLTLACIEAGKPVLCEKPLAPTAAAARCSPRNRNSGAASCRSAICGGSTLPMSR